MDETILFPSPNWFLPSVLTVSQDGWLVYGGPGRSLVVLEPISPEFDGVIDSSHRYKAHVIHRSNKERVVSVDLTPEWPGKRHFVTGSSDGAVKEWTVTQADNKWSIKNIHSHEEHTNEKEEVIGVGYSKATHVISVGSFSRVVVWELNTNTTNSYVHFMRHFKATCLSCSPHCPLVVAVGTKQGVVFVLDLNGKGNIVYKVRGQDDEIAQVSWCPQYEVTLKRSFEEKKSLATQRLEKIRNDVDSNDLDLSGTDQELPKDSFSDTIPKDSLSESMQKDSFNESAPKDSFNESVAEDDMFDIYKDHEANEFGHKKYQPEDIFVKMKDDGKKDDFLAECEKLKAQILKNKQEEEDSIESLVAAMDKTHVDEPTEGKKSEEGTSLSGVASLGASSSKLLQNDGTDHVHRHLLASICKKGYSVRIWSKTGKVVASCAAVVTTNTYNKSHGRTPHSATLHWYTPEILLIADGKTHLLECNPLSVDCRNRLRWSVLHSHHRRGLYYVTSKAPRVQTGDEGVGEWCVWTVGQDRNLLKYELKSRALAAKYGTCGGFLYNVTPCPYDASKIAIGVGDGSLRIWETHTTGEEDSKLTLGEVTCFWQNVQGKVLQCAWHPTKENLLAFSTAESRVGLLDTSKGDRPAKVLQTALTNGVYSIAWGEDMALFAVGGRELVMYQANKPDQAPIPIQIEIEGQKWEPSVVEYSSHGLTVASTTGGVAVFSGPGGRALAAKFVFTLTIHAVQWHPQQTSGSDEESPYKDLMAVTAQDKNYTVVILRFHDREGGGQQLSSFNSLVGHTDKVLQAYWSPHRDEQILSSSADSTVRVWDAINGVCLSIFDGHSMGSLGAAWCALPQLADKVLSGGNDFCLRLWDINDFPAENYTVTEVKKETKKRKRNKNKPTTEQAVEDAGKESDEAVDKGQANKEINKEQGNQEKDKEETDKDVLEEEQSDEEATVDGGVKLLKTKGRRLILPIMAKQFTRLTDKDNGLILLQKYVEMYKETRNTNILELTTTERSDLYDIDLLKLFGNINQVNQVLDMECKSHLELGAYREYIMLMIFRGRIDSVVQFANEHDLLDPFLVSIAPCVSFKFWKDVTQLYVAQIDRLAVKKNEASSSPYPILREYPWVFRKAAALLSVHDVRGAVHVLEKMNLYKEAYILCRCRHMDSVAEETLNKWAWYAGYVGNLTLGAILFIVQGKITEAATLLRRSKNQEILNCAAELAKSAGLNMFADYIETKAKNSEKESTSEKQTEELLQELPTRMELLMKEIKDQNGDSNIPDTLKEMRDENEPFTTENTDQNGESKIVSDVVKNNPLEQTLNESVTQENGDENGQLDILEKKLLELTKENNDQNGKTVQNV